MTRGTAPQPVADAIRAEAARNEGKIHRLRLLIALLPILMVSIARAHVGARVDPYVLAILVSCASYAVLASVCWRWYQRQADPSWPQYLLLTLDVLFVLALLLVSKHARGTMGVSFYPLIIDVPGFLLFFLFVALSGLRFDFAVSVYCGAAAVVVLAGLTLVDYHHGVITHPSMVFWPVAKGIVLMGLALVSWHVGNRAKRLLVESYLAQQEKIAALQANPLSGLPGNNIIVEKVQEAIDQNANATVIYCDLDNFKAFNDRYGFARGDRVLLRLAGILTDTVESICGSQGFVGHVGGDDFVVMVPSDRAEELGAEIARRFDEQAPSWYDDADRERGAIETRDRQGQLQRFPLMALSMAGVHLGQRELTHYLEVSSICAECKKYAKARPGSGLLIDRRRGDGPPDGDPPDGPQPRSKVRTSEGRKTDGPAG
jgi:GGDEF domain-containing protein